MFPEIKDWTDPMNDIRLSDNVRDMSYNDWFWFHPSAFSLIHFGYPVISILFFLGVTLLTAFVLKWAIVWIFPVLGIGYFVYDLVKKIKTKDHYNMMTMHDVYLRENTYIQIPK